MSLKLNCCNTGFTKKDSNVTALHSENGNFCKIRSGCGVIGHLRVGSLLADNLLGISKCTTTVGNPLINPNVEYSTINAAIVAGETDLCVITDIVEIVATTISGQHITINLMSGVSVTNTIAPVATWFIGGNNLLSIFGNGVHFDSTNDELSSQMTLQEGQSFLSGTDAELHTRGVRYSGNGTNTFTSGSSTIENCRFDTAETFNFNSFVDKFYVNNCFLVSDIDIESPGLLASSGMIFTNNNFENHNLIISSATLDASIISDNIWTGSGAGGITINNNANDVTITGNTLVSIALGNVVCCSTVSNNTINGAMEFTGAVTDCAIADNSCDSITFQSDVGIDGSPVSITGNTCTSGTIIIMGAITSVMVTGNNTTSGYTFNGNVLRSNISSNGGTSFLCNGTIDESTICDNRMHGSFDFKGTIRRSNISNNGYASMFFRDVVGTDTTPTVISDNMLDGALWFEKDIIITTIAGNTVQSFGVVVDGNMTDSNISGNTIKGGPFGIRINGTFDDCTINGNTCAQIYMAQNIIDSNISGNTVKGGGDGYRYNNNW